MKEETQAENTGARGSVGTPRPRIHNKKMLGAIHAVIIEYSGNETLANAVVEHIRAPSDSSHPKSDSGSGSIQTQVVGQTELSVILDQIEQLPRCLYDHCQDRGIRPALVKALRRAVRCINLDAGESWAEKAKAEILSILTSAGDKENKDLETKPHPRNN